jgi:hypothetical protein
MQEITVHVNNTHSVGLGDNLCFLSAMANLPPKVSLLVNNDHNTYNRLAQYIKIFKIPKSQLELKQVDENGDFDNTGWPIKVFTDYYKPLSVNANGNILNLNKGRGKKCIALVTAFDKDPNGLNEWPWCRNRSLDYWAKLFSWIKSMGYEVITLDDPFHDLETKIEILAKHCCAMISYEGGMAHLAHMMNIPCFILDWTYPNPSTNLNVFHVDFVHRSDSVYIIRNDDEPFSWDRITFDRITEQMREGNGNNRLVTKEFYFNFIGPNFLNDVRIFNKNDLLCLQLPSFLGRGYAEFLYKYYQNT